MRCGDHLVLRTTSPPRKLYRWAAAASRLFLSGSERPKFLDESLRVELKPVIHDATIGCDHHKPWGSAGPVGLHDCWRSVYLARARARARDSTTKWKTQSISALVFPQTIEGIDFRTLEHSLYRREAGAPSNRVRIARPSQLEILVPPVAMDRRSFVPAEHINRSWLARVILPARLPLPLTEALRVAQLGGRRCPVDHLAGTGSRTAPEAPPNRRDRSVSRKGLD